jgi:hypothetical protein
MEEVRLEDLGSRCLQSMRDIFRGVVIAGFVRR